MAQTRSAGTVLGGLRAWCEEQQALLVAEHPGFVAALRRLSRSGARVVVLVGFLVLALAQLRGSHGDSGGFAEAGSRLVHGHLDVFRSSWLQVGPFYLLMVGVGAVLSSAVDAPVWAGGALVTSAVSGVLLVAATRALAPAASPLRRDLLAGLVVLLGGAMVIPGTYGHPEEVITALLLVVATGQARNPRRTWSPALLVAAAVTIKLWAVVGVALLLVAATRRVLLARGLVLAAAALAAYLPFSVFGGHLGTFDHVWQVEIPAPLSLLLRDGFPFGYQERLFQVLVAAGIGAVVARRARPADAVWAVPLTLMAARLLLDPLPNPYYWTALAVVVLLRLVLLARSLLECVVLAFFGNIAMLLVITTAQGVAGAVAFAALGLVVLALTLRTALLRPRVSHQDTRARRVVAAAG